MNFLQQCPQDNAHYFPDKHEANLTHADFDPSNMLVKKINGHYQISAIFDWEFAFSGTYLFDVGLFFRYSYRLPEIYERRAKMITLLTPKLIKCNNKYP